jgi:hypothetical protein
MNQRTPIKPDVPVAWGGMGHVGPLLMCRGLAVKPEFCNLFQKELGKENEGESDAILISRCKRLEAMEKIERAVQEEGRKVDLNILCFFCL